MDFGKKAPKTPANEDKKMAKMKALTELRSAMSGHEKEGLGKAIGMKKVTVAAPDEKGLEKGLETAKDLIGDKNMEAEPKEYGAEEETDQTEVDMDEMVDCLESEAEIEEMMRKLQEKKATLKK
jgi:hypothetical protein